MVTVSECFDYLNVPSSGYNLGKCVAESCIITNSLICFFLMLFLLYIELTRNRFEWKKLIKV